MLAAHLHNASYSLPSLYFNYPPFLQIGISREIMEVIVFILDRIALRNAGNVVIALFLGLARRLHRNNTVTMRLLGTKKLLIS